MKERILQTLTDLRKYALSKGITAFITYHEEENYLMRFANSAISLNTNDQLIHLDITVYDGRKRTSYEMITDLGKLDEMKRGVDIAAGMVRHAQPLSYEPTIPLYAESFEDDHTCDMELVHLSNAERLAYFNTVAGSLESSDIKLSGIFSCGASTMAMINTRSEHTQYFKHSDAQINAVLAHESLKWEVQAEQSAFCKADLDPVRMNKDLAFLIKHHLEDDGVQLPLGKYDIVFGSSAIAHLLRYLNWIGFNGGMWKRGYSFMDESKVGKRVLSEHFTLLDDPSRPETFPYQRDFYGMPRKTRPLFDKGVFTGFIWMQDDADEFSTQPTGHTVDHISLAVSPGEEPVATLEELASRPRERDLLYIPYMHYMNIVNPTKGVITGSSRFGALLLKKDGGVVVPFNVRLTQSYLDLFGSGIAWLSKDRVACNVSDSYFSRSPQGLFVPAFIRVNDLEISHSNSSY